MSSARDPLAALGALADRIAPGVRATAAYHVPVPPVLRAKLDANELPYALPAALRAGLAAVIAALPFERYPDPAARDLRRAVAASLDRTAPPFGGAESRGRAASLDPTAPPFGGAESRGRAASLDPTAPPFGGAESRGRAASLGITGEQLTFGNGSDELIAMLCAAVPGPVLFPVPSFVYYRMAAIARGLPTVEVPLGPRFELDESAVHAAITAQRPTLVFLALPNNPTGTLWRMDFAVELAAAYPDVVVVSDEAYVAYSQRTNLPHVAAHPNLVVMRTLSKIGMAALRVGFTIASPVLAGVLERVRPPYNLSALDQAAATYLVDAAGPWCAARAADVIAERARLAAALTARGLDVLPSEANLLLVRVPDAPATHARLAAAGISVRTFGAGAGRLAEYLRITVGTPAETAALLAAW